MNDIDESDTLDGSGSGDLAVIGEGTGHRTEVSIQVLQNIYHELTGKTEDVSKTFDDPFRIKKPDFEQLDHRLAQVCEQYNICSSNCSITVFYLNDTKDTFSSFERFGAFNTGNTSAVESVLFTYNFLVIFPKLNQPQSYTVSVRIASPVTVEAQMRAGIPFEMPKIIRLLRGKTAVATVKYVDYVVARNLLNAIEEWFGTLDKAHVPRWWLLLRKHTDYLPLISRYFVGAVSVLIIFLSIPDFLTENSTLPQFAQVMLLSFAGLFGAYKLAHHIGSTAEDSIDGWSPVSYIELTAGDRKQIREAKRKNRNNLIAGGLKFVAGLLVSAVVQIGVDQLNK